MRQLKVIDILEEQKLLQEIKVCGWIRSFRNGRFIAINDGSTLNNLQCVIEDDVLSSETIDRLTTAASVSITGVLKESEGKGQRVELEVKELLVQGDANVEEVKKTILSPKKHSLELLREQAHLRIRTNTFGAIMRVRSKLSFAVHQYFQNKNFQLVHTPIITSSDAEGAGETFKVSQLDFDNIPKSDEGTTNFKKDFFGKSTNLTVSGQLEGETYAMGLGDIYTFGPTFRAENSNTSRHLAEFWMIEPEMAFCDLDKNMDVAEEFIKFVVTYVLEHCKDDLAFLEKRLLDEEKQKPLQERSEMPLREKLAFVTENNFKRVSYTEAIEILKNSKPNKKKKFKYPVNEWGVDLQSEHERYLVEKHFKCPVILFNYPAAIKAFYMRLNDDGNTVRAMDILFPGIGEIVGGSQREERLEVLKEKMNALDIDQEELYWYLDTRRFGSCVHSGFGLGFERLVLFVTGMSNVRDVIPYPRTPGNADF